MMLPGQVSPDVWAVVRGAVPAALRPASTTLVAWRPSWGALRRPGIASTPPSRPESHPGPVQAILTPKTPA
jgi:hypothetical protein